MGFFSRIWRIIRGKTNETVEALEDRNFETVIQQNIKDMETELNKVVRASAEAMSNHNRLEQEFQKFVSGSNEWHERAKQALGAGNEELARKALAKKSEFDNQINVMRTSVEQAKAVKDKLKTQVDAYRTRIEEARRNAATLVARKNAAEAQKKVAEVLAGIQNDTAFAQIRRFEDKVSKQEANIAALQEFALDHSSTSLEDEFAKLGTSSTSLDNSLDALRAELQAEKAQGKRM